MMKYEEFIGEKKSKIAEIMGHGFNYFPNNIWTPFFTSGNSFCIFLLIITD